MKLKANTVYKFSYHTGAAEMTVKVRTDKAGELTDDRWEAGWYTDEELEGCAAAHVEMQFDNIKERMLDGECEECPECEVTL